MSVNRQLSHLLSNLSITTQDNSEDEEGFIVLEHHLNEIHDKIINRPETDQPMICDCYEYMKAVDEIQKLTDYLENYKRSNSNASPSLTPLLGRAHFVLHKAMSSLADEFRRLLLHNIFRHSSEPVNTDNVDDPVDPDLISDLKSIVNVMFESNYEHECCQVFVDVRKDALEDCLVDLQVANIGIEDVLKVEWSPSNSELGLWMRAMHLFVRVHLPAEKLLTEQVFSDLGSTGPDCFVQSSKHAVFQLLSFGKAIRPHLSDKLFQILDMYKLLKDLIPDINELYPPPDESWVHSECLDVVKRLGQTAKATYLEFQYSVATNASSKALAKGGVHHITRYVMNYIKPLMDHKETLDEVLDQINPLTDDNNRDTDDEAALDSVFFDHVRYLVLVLEQNLERKSNMYEDKAQTHIFMMNNLHYMAEKVKKNSELRTVLGDGWIRVRITKFQQHAVSYERAAWKSVLGLLADVGIRNADSGSVSVTLFKERLQLFYREFEKLYKNQTGWLVPNEQLRDDMRISISIKLIRAYSTFVGRHVGLKTEKHIKYTVDEMSGFLLHLFEGKQKSLGKK